jgi:type II secretory pathway pseudopilin PulG
MNTNLGNNETKQKRVGGFTLVELAAVIVAIGLMAVVLLPALAGTKESSRIAQCRSNVREICAAISIYANANNDYMPPLQWRGTGNDWYPSEMFRYMPVGTPVPPGAFGLGPVNLGVVWTSGILTDGKIFYCPADMNNDQLTYNYYTVKGAWPWGANPANLNPTYVQSGYMYYPQSRQTVSITTSAPGGKKTVPQWPSYMSSPQPLMSWVCVPLFKQTSIDPKKSMVTDPIVSFARIPHQDLGVPIGLNAGFGDGHVNWQAVKVVTDGFNMNVWQSIAADMSQQSSLDYEYAMSCWRP